MIKILLVDDHAMFRKGVITVLTELIGAGIEFHEAEDGQQAMNMAADSEFNLVLLDLSLPDQSGMNILSFFKQHYPKLPVIILSTHPEEHYAVRALRSGAAGYVNKRSSSTELKDAIEKALSNRRYINPIQAEMLAAAVFDKNEYGQVHEALSDRELQVACMLTAGKTLTNLAKELSISVQTASSYRSRVLIKLNLKTTAEIINYCIQHNLSV